MNVDQAFPSRFLKASDLQGTEPVVTIARVELEAIGRDKDHKLVAYFEGKAKGLILNKTNAKRIAELVGSPETEDWIGQSIRLFATTAEFAGETFETVRVKAAGAPRAAAPAPPSKPLGVITDASDIPF